MGCVGDILMLNHNFASTLACVIENHLYLNYVTVNKSMMNFSIGPEIEKAYQ